METKKKLLFLITKSNFGGAQKYVHDLATGLPREEYDIAVAAGGTGELARKLREAGIRTIGIPLLERDISIWKEIAVFFDLISLFRDEQPDIIHLNSSKVGALGSVAAFFYKLTAGRFGAKVVFTVHGWPFHEDRYLFSRVFIHGALILASFFQDRIIVINRADYRDALSFIPQEKLAFIPNGIPEPNFLPREEARRELASLCGADIRPDTVVVGTIAELTKNKGLSYLVEAMGRVRIQNTRVRFLCCIIGGGEERETLQKEIASRGLENAVRLAGFRTDAHQLLRGFDIFALPSLKEGLPYTILEALAARLPIVAANVGGIPDAVESNISGILVPPRNAKALAAGISELLASPDRRRELGAGAAHTHQTRSQLTDMVDWTHFVYEQD